MSETQAPPPAVRRIFVEALVVAGALALGVVAGRAQGGSLDRVEQSSSSQSSTREVVRLKEVEKLSASKDEQSDETRGGTFTGEEDTTVKPDGTKTTHRKGVVVWSDRKQESTSQRLALDLTRTADVQTRIETRTETKTVTIPPAALTLGIGAGGPFGFVPLHLEPSVALFGVYRVGELFKIPISVWAVVSLQPPTFAPNAAFVGVAASLP